MEILSEQDREYDKICSNNIEVNFFGNKIREYDKIKEKGTCNKTIIYQSESETESASQ